MPAPLNVDKEAVRALVVAVGVREAARQMNLPAATVAAWSARGKWTAKVKAAQQLAVIAKPVQSSAIKPADALANAIADDETAVKSSLSRAIRRTAAHMEGQDGATTYETAEKAKQVVGMASQLYRWESKDHQPGVAINVWGATGMSMG